MTRRVFFLFKIILISVRQYKCHPNYARNLKIMYFVYILTNFKNTVLYVGVTNNLKHRLQEHREKKISGFTSRYRVSKLVWYDIFQTPHEAISAEKKIKGWGRGKKLALIMKANPQFSELDVSDSSRRSE